MVRTMIAILAALAVAPPAAAQCGASGPSRLFHELNVTVTTSDTGDLARPLSDLGAWLSHCDESAGRRSAAAFRRLLSRSPSNPTYSALHSLALAWGPEVHPTAADGYLYRETYQNTNSEREAVEGIRRAFEADGQFLLIDALVGLTLATRNTSTVRAAQEMLASAEHRFSTHAAYWRARGDIAIAAGEYEAAASYGKQAAEMGDPTGLWITGVAEMLSGNASGGAALYLQGLRTASTSRMPRYYEDVRLVSTPGEIAPFDQQPTLPDARWIERRWELSAAQAAVSVAERLAEHHRRLVRALDQFRKAGVRVSGDGYEDYSRSSPFDVRGLIYVRHGDPDRIVTSGRSRAGGIQRTAWIYHGLDNGTAIFEFSLRPGWRDYVLTSPLQCEPWLYMYADPEPVARRKFLSKAPDSISLPSWQGDMESDFLTYGAQLAAYDRWIGAQVVSCWHGVRSSRSHEDRVAAVEEARARDALSVALMRRKLRTALATESAARLTSLAEAPVASVYTFRASSGTEVAAFIGLDGGTLERVERSGTYAYAIAVTLSVEYSSGNVVRRDTTISTTTAAPLTTGSLLRLAFNLPSAPPDTAVTTRITVRDANAPGRGNMMIAVTDLPDFRASAFMMSDIVVTDASTEVWQRGHEKFGPVPGHSVPPQFGLYYELYGATPDDSIQTDLKLVPAGTEGILARIRSLVERRQAVWLTFDEIVQPDVDGVLRTLREFSGEIEPGRYELILQVANRRSGLTAIRKTWIQIR